jgi:hypothetical protein
MTFQFSADSWSKGAELDVFVLNCTGSARGKRRQWSALLVNLFRKNLFNAVAQTRVCADFHLWHFDNFSLVLHLNADHCTFVLVDGMAHAQAAPTARLIFWPRRTGEHQGGENDDYCHEFASQVHWTGLQAR